MFWDKIVVNIYFLQNCSIEKKYIDKKLCTFKNKNKKFIYFFADILFCFAILPLFLTLEFDLPLPPNVLSLVFPFMPLFLPPNPYFASFPFRLCCDLKHFKYQHSYLL